VLSRAQVAITRIGGGAAGQRVEPDDARGVRRVMSRHEAVRYGGQPVCSFRSGYASPAGTHGECVGLTLIPVGTEIRDRSCKLGQVCWTGGSKHGRSPELFNPYQALVLCLELQLP